MRFRTCFGLLIIIALGSTVAWLFRRAESASPVAAQSNFGGQSLFGNTQSTRGQIVPLAVGNSFSGTAFIGAGEGNDNEPPHQNGAERRVTCIAGIGKSAAIEPASPTPSLDNSFPGPLEMLGFQSAPQEGAIADVVATEFVPAIKIQRPEPIAPESTITTARPTYDETPASQTRREPSPATHRIVDGDTLPFLAQRYLGDAKRAAEIYAANRDKLPSAELLPIGVEIALPASLRRIPAVSDAQ